MDKHPARRSGETMNTASAQPGRRGRVHGVVMDVAQVGLTQEAQHRLHRDYRSIKVAGRKLPGGALSVRDAWVGFKTRGPRKCFRM